MTDISRPLLIACFDFDGTLRDGLKEKVFTIQTAVEITGRILGFSIDKKYVDEDMRALAGVALGDIITRHWPDVAAAHPTFSATCAEVWNDIYHFYNLQTRDAKGIKPTTQFTDAEKTKILTGMPKAEWFDGTQQLLRDLHQDDIYTGVLSNTPEVESLRNEIASGGVLPYVRNVFTGSPLGLGKPNAYALLHFIASAWGEQQEDKKQLTVLQDAYARKDTVGYVSAVDGLLESLRASGPKISVLMIGDGVPDIKVGHHAAQALAEKGLSEQVEIVTLALTYGFMSEAQLRPENPSIWASSPAEMGCYVYLWAVAQIVPKPSQIMRQSLPALKL